MEINSMWMWLAVAAILLAGEMITTSFVLLFFAFAAFVTAILNLVRPDLPLAVQLIVFGVLGLLGLALGRKWIKAKVLTKGAPAYQADFNSEFIVDRDIAPGAEGAVLYQGTPWTALNEGAAPIKAGDRVKVVRTSGIKIMIAKVN